MADLYEIDGYNSDAPENELQIYQKLDSAERSNEIYRQQLKYMQDHLAALRALVSDKENIVENLMLRYDLGIVPTTSIDYDDAFGIKNKLKSDDIDRNELHQRAWYMAQITILENFKLREMVNELRDENFHLQNDNLDLVKSFMSVCASMYIPNCVYTER